MILALASDHGGFELKEFLKRKLLESGHKVIDLGTKPATRIKIVTPLISLTKKEVVQKGHELDAPFHLTWSCYQSEDLACGECDSCSLRLRGFQEAGLEDPIIYAKKPSYVR